MILENAQIRVELDENTGGFTSIVAKTSDTEYVLVKENAQLFRLIAPTDQLLDNPINASGITIDGGGDSATLTYDIDGISAEASITLDGADIVTRLRVNNTSDLTIEETIFPWVRGLAPLDKGDLVWPSMSLRKIPNLVSDALGGDHVSWSQTAQKICNRYPLDLTSAWVDYTSEGAGIALEGRQTDFSIMDFYLHKVLDKTKEPIQRSVDFGTVHPRRVKPGESWESPEVRVKIHDADWHTIAQEHREWLETWITKPARSKKMAESIGWHFFFMKKQNLMELTTYEDLPKMAEAALAAGCPYLMVFGWHVNGHDNNYFYRYFPNDAWGGAEELRKALADVRAMGVEVIPFYNGTLANVLLEEHKEFGHRWELKTRAGAPAHGGDWARHDFDAPTPNRSQLHVEICPCKEHREYFVDSVKRIVDEYDFANLQLDQIAHKMRVCYNPDHNHDYPDRAYVDGFADIVSRCQAVVREKNPDGVVIAEGINNFIGQWADSAWTWQQINYPEPVLYTTPWLMFSHELDGQEFDRANLAFLYKLHLDMKIDGGDSPITKYPKTVEHVKGLACLRRKTLDHYVYADFRDEDGLSFDETDGIRVKTYVNETTGKVGIVAAETSGKAATIALSHEWQPHDGQANVESSQRSTVTIDCTPRLTIDLQPYEVKVVCLDLD